MDGACLGGGDRMWNEMHTLQQFRCGFFWEGLLLTLIFQRPKCYKNPQYDTKKPCIIAEDFLWISTFLFSVGRTCSNMPLREWIVRLHILFLKLFHHSFLFLIFFSYHCIKLSESNHQKAMKQSWNFKDCFEVMTFRIDNCHVRRFILFVIHIIMAAKAAIF